jgi:uncharacterized integral membrane protein (TIGR00697 family)
MPDAVQSDREVRTGEFRYLGVISGLFIASLLISNTIAGKPWELGRFVFPAGTILFPMSYIFGDVLTEVYGYARTRQVIWTGFLANILMVCVYVMAIALPPANFWSNQNAFSVILGQVPRVVLASFVAYLIGEFANSFVMAKMKIWTGGRHLWARTIGSTIIGQGLDTFAFIVIGFLGVWPAKYIFFTGLSVYTFKVLYEIVATPATYIIVRFLKKREHIDFYDDKTNFSPLAWSGRR